MGKREQEIQIVYEMIHLYCKKKHKRKELCQECKELFDYAKERVNKCPFMDTKTFCSQCKVHCYQATMRDRIREVMCFSGPRMLYSHPIMAIRHLYYQIIEKI